MRRARIRLWFFVVLALLLGGILLVLFLPGGVGILRSDPRAVRPWANYDAVLSPPQAKPFVPATNLLDALTLTSNATALQIVIDDGALPPAAESPLAWRVVEADAALRADLGQGVLRVDYLAVGWGMPEEGEDNGFALQVPGRFFGPDLTPFAEADFDRLRITPSQRRLSFRDGYPLLRVGFGLEQSDGFKFLGARVYDGRTQAPLSAGASGHGTRGPGFYVDERVSLWHETEVVLVVDVATGPPEVFEFPPTPGVRQVFPGGAVTLLRASEGSHTSWSSSSTGTRATIDLGFAAGTDVPGCCLVFFCEPDLHPAPFDLEVLGSDGKPLRGGGGPRSGRIALEQARASVGDVAAVRLCYYPNQCRAVFRLPRLPGLPEANLAVEDLLAVRVPYARFAQPYALQQWLGDVLQLRLDVRSHLTASPGAFPLAVTNVTVGEVFQQWLSRHPAGTSVHWDAAKLEAEIARHPAYELLDRARLWLSGKFN